jgi:hypothetical protein
MSDWNNSLDEDRDMKKHQLYYKENNFAMIIEAVLEL